ncbi:MAG: acyl-CoA dehydrogenase family protein [Minicystis sp.]
MNFDLTDEQKLLEGTAASFAKKQSPLTRLRALRSDPLGWTKEVWAQMGEFGWLAVAFPEAAGGLGGSFTDIALILEQLGTTLVPEPIIAALIAGFPLARLGTDAQREAHLAPMLEGRTSLALAFAEVQSRYDVADVVTRATKSNNGYRLDGSKRWVLNGHAADTIVVSARTSGGDRDPQGISLFLVDRRAPGLTVTPVKTMDGHHAAMLTFEGVALGADLLLGAEGEAFGALEEAMDIGAAAACAEGVGITRAALAMTTEYLRTREQFGVKIGSFQALQHRAVDMFVETELCKSTSILASLKVFDADPVERRSAISAAKVQLAVGGRFVTQQAIQLHGGIGVTDEHDIGLYFKRMHALNSLFGDEEFHVARFASQPSFTAGLTASAS